MKRQLGAWWPQTNLNKDLDLAINAIALPTVEGYKDTELEHLVSDYTVRQCKVWCGFAGQRWIGVWCSVVCGDVVQWCAVVCGGVRCNAVFVHLCIHICASLHALMCACLLRWSKT